ncbi:hypothetical protein Y1Q_0017196 [Alligator mississippiensis]|uniref:Uncharacterized protein n=1 Tax=Alligator mississippiensis TaxID=8496 RepID=A0A151MPY2_ALLMI|nr:hypothetical protein Y1Q_0017196 [Alligator mississippiensis]
MCNVFARTLPSLWNIKKKTNTKTSCKFRAKGQVQDRNKAQWMLFKNKYQVKKEMGMGIPVITWQRDYRKPDPQRLDTKPLDPLWEHISHCLEEHGMGNEGEETPDPESRVEGPGRANRVAYLGVRVPAASGEQHPESKQPQTCFRSVCLVQVGRKPAASSCTRNFELAPEESQQPGDSWDAGKDQHQEKSWHAKESRPGGKCLHAEEEGLHEERQHTRESRHSG